MQAASDILLGWLPALGFDGRERDFYVRQLWDGKRSVDADTLSPPGLAIYGRFCGWTLARAHARSGDRIAIGSYLGKGDTFDQAIAEFSERYADQNELDYGALADAAKSGRIHAETDLSK
jgi:predicted alpha/beta hydrolase